MAIPKDILKIPRPSSTRVKATSKEGIYQCYTKNINKKKWKNYSCWKRSDWKDY